jgi:hypothetical protein
MKSEDVAFARLAAIGPSPAERAKHDEVQRQIDFTMRQVIAGAKYNPNALDAPMVKVVPQGAVPVTVPGEPEWKGLDKPWRNSNPTQDWLRLGTSVAQANIESAEKALREAGEEDAPKE